MTLGTPRLTLFREEKHIMEDGLVAASRWTPPWKKSIQASVEWKRATQCPEKFPLCYKDGDCALRVQSPRDSHGFPPRFPSVSHRCSSFCCVARCRSIQVLADCKSGCVRRLRQAFLLWPRSGRELQAWKANPNWSLSSQRIDNYTAFCNINSYHL